MTGWVREGNVWRWLKLPLVKVAHWRPALGSTSWAVYVGGDIYKYITPSKSSAEVMHAAERYFERRLELC